MDFSDATLVPGIFGPALRGFLTRLLIKLSALEQQLLIKTGVALLGCNKPDAAVAMLMVVPIHPRPLAHKRASWRASKGLTGICGRYFRHRNSDSKYGLSLLTDGRLRDGVTPSSYIMASMVCPFMGEPLSECTVTCALITPWR